VPQFHVLSNITLKPITFFVLTSIVFLLIFFPYRRYLCGEYNKEPTQQNTTLSHKSHPTRTESNSYLDIWKAIYLPQRHTCVNFMYA